MRTQNRLLVFGLLLLLLLVVVTPLASAGDAAPEVTQPAAAPSEEAQEATRLTINQVVEMALQNSPTVLLKDFAVREAELDLKQANVNLRVTVTPQQLEQVEAGLAAAKAEAELARRAQALAAREHYINVLKAEHTLSLSNAAEEQANRHLSLERERLAAGLATDTSIYEAESALRRAQVAQHQAEATLESERMRLNQLLSRDLRAAFQLVDDVRYETPGWDLERDTQQALAARLDVQVLKNQLELAERRLSAADPKYTSQAQIERLSIAVERAQIALDQSTTRVVLEVRDAVLQLEIKRIAVDLAADALEQQRKQLQVAALRHDSGLITTAELMDAQVAANVAEVAAVQALYDHALAVTRYHNVTGSDSQPAQSEG